jgi:exonuclease VII small subunit
MNKNQQPKFVSKLKKLKNLTQRLEPQGVPLWC